ncbi:MAG: hypothetical protein V1717_02405 [Candidatus Micrarchaeota archaeon]
MKQMKKPEKKPLVALVFIALFVLLVVVTIFSFNPAYAPDFLLPVVQYHFELMILIAIAGMFVGAAVYYLLSEQVVSTQTQSRKNVEILLKLLSEDERKVVRKLLAGNGKAMQYEISRLDGLTRLKAHRIVYKLERQGIVEIEKIGKVNAITLVGEIKEALQ